MRRGKQSADELAFSEALESGIAPRLKGTYADLRDQLLHLAAEKSEMPSTSAEQAALLLQFARRQAQRIGQFHDAASLFSTRYAHALDEPERRAAILDFAEALGADRNQLRRDTRALGRFFDADAVTDRYRKRVGERERALAYANERLGQITGHAIADGTIDPAATLLTRSIADHLADMRFYLGDGRVRQSAHRCLRLIAEAAPDRLHGFWVDVAVRDTRRVALDGNDDTWAQCDALATLLVLSPDSLTTVLNRRLDSASDAGSPLRQDNRMFIRRHIARLLAGAVGQDPQWAVHLTRLANDRDGAVRQAIAEALPLMPGDLFASLSTRMRTDRDPQVRAMVFAEPEAMAVNGGGTVYLSHMLRVLQREEDEFVLRITLDAAVRLGAWLRDHEPDDLLPNIASLRMAMADLRTRIEAPKIRRWAGEASERLWLLADPEAIQIADEVTFAIGGLREGKMRKIRELSDPVTHDPEKVGRVLAVLAQDDFGLDLQQGRIPKLLRGERLARRMWRILFELRNSSTDKRQAFFHTIGRHFPGSLSAPSARMAELAPTKVPGEPLFQSEEGGWRNFVPLLDHVLSALDRGGETQIFTSEGITTVRAPRGIFARMRAFWRISTGFAPLAGLRNRDPHEYISALRGHGLDVEFRSYIDDGSEQGAAADPAVTKLYSFGGVAAALPVVWDKALAYFATVYQNSLFELGIFLGLASAWFFGRHIVLGWRARRLRNALPLSLGGWGTRGKSGTERLKAGLMNALGTPLVSKTTGCEAMFLLGNSFGELTEMFLFRPYDKATIWEQLNLLRISHGLGARVFLWECMGLNPAYVRVLQQDWMRDDIGTITNTYPDHEDVQGPAGRNIPEVMCQFIPENSLLLTTEEEMLPILRQGAEQANTRLRVINWKQAGLVHERLLDRFPYAEHPYNIALVTAMGDELGLTPDFCVKEMSDRVVADLGVLKVYPRSQIDGRTLEFVMGMSANERFGAMGNWSRMGFAQHDLEHDPEIFVSTVVNNRADRVPRSRVFARMLVHDVSADRHFLIGSNIDGLMGFIEEEWVSYAASITLSDEEATPLEALAALARHQRIPRTQDQLDGRLAAMIADQAELIDLQQTLDAARTGNLQATLEQAQVAHADDIAAHYAQQSALLVTYLTLHSAVEQEGASARVEEQLRAFLHEAFVQKLVPVRDYYISGEKIVRLVARNTPPGLVNRIMGMQNIKGTGLDFVYRWQAWEAVCKACAQAREGDLTMVDRALQLLAGFQEYGVLSEQLVRSVMKDLRNSTNLPPTMGPAQLDAIISRMDQQIAAFGPTDGGTETAGEAQSSGLFARVKEGVAQWFEAFLDAGDAIRRRRAADRIYAALIAEQIGNQRAALELKKLTTRQKGGWLAGDLIATSAKLRKFFGSRHASGKDRLADS